MRHGQASLVLIMSPVGETAGRYYFDEGAVPGRWCGAARGELGLDGIVGRRDLDAVLRGRDPVGGDRLDLRRRAHRRAGWDLILTAPKSVSLLAALSPPEAAERLTAAHRRACADAFTWLEQHGCWARRAGGLVATSGLLAARFGHDTSTAGEPHLHTHVLIANVVRAGDGRWSALDGSGIWLNRRAIAAVYHLALRQQTSAAGLRLPWTVRPDGSADLAEVPRRAIEATSTRHRQVQERIADDPDPTRSGRTAAQRLSRSAAQPQEPWAVRAEAAGFGRDSARRVIEAGRARATDSPPVREGGRLSGEVVTWLAARRSTFGPVDVMQALAASHPEGTDGVAADEWARRFCLASPLGVDGRRTSEVARRADAALARSGELRLGAGAGIARIPAGGGRDAGGRSEAAGDGARDSHAWERLTTSGHGVEVLAAPGPRSARDGWRVIGSRGGFVAQAEVLGAARHAWERAGHRVAVTTPSPLAARRWKALAGLDAHAAGSALPSVLIVDRADRRPTAELAALLDDAAGAGTKVVLVEGGTQPARRAALSGGLTALGARLGRVVPESLDVGSLGVTAGLAAGRIGRSPSGRHALEQVVATWAGFDLARGGSPDGRPSPPGATASLLPPDPRRPARQHDVQMVALGPAECDELNRLARRARRTAGMIQGPDVEVGGRPFAVGDAVVTTRRGPLPAGEPGVVSGIGADGALVVQGGDGPVRVDRWEGRGLRHAYAVTPGLLRADGRPLVALARPEDLGRHRARLVAVALVGPGPALGRTDGPRREEFSRRQVRDDPGLSR